MVVALEQFPRILDIKTLRSFLGFASYYRKFVPYYSIQMVWYHTIESGEDTYHYDLPMRQNKYLDLPDIIRYIETDILQDEGKAQTLLCPGHSMSLRMMSSTKWSLISVKGPTQRRRKELWDLRPQWSNVGEMNKAMRPIDQMRRRKTNKMQQSEIQRYVWFCVFRAKCIVNVKCAVLSCYELGVKLWWNNYESYNLNSSIFRHNATQTSQEFTWAAFQILAKIEWNPLAEEPNRRKFRNYMYTTNVARLECHMKVYDVTQYSSWT